MKIGWNLAVGRPWGFRGSIIFKKQGIFFFALVMRLLIIYWRLILKPGVVGHYQNQHCQTLFLEFMSIPRRPSTTAKIVL